MAGLVLAIHVAPPGSRLGSRKSTLRARNGVDAPDKPGHDGRGVVWRQPNPVTARAWRGLFGCQPSSVMAGLVPAVHVAPPGSRLGSRNSTLRARDGVDARDKPGHDGRGVVWRQPNPVMARVVW